MATYIEYSFDSNISEDYTPISLKFTRGSVQSYRLNVNFKKDNENWTIPTGMSAKFWAQKSDGTRVYIDASYSGSIATAIVGGQALAVSGLLICAFEFITTSQDIIMPPFQAEVLPTPKSDSAIKSSDEFLALETYVNQARTYSNSASGYSNSAYNYMSTASQKAAAASSSAAGAAQSAADASQAKTDTKDIKATVENLKTETDNIKEETIETANASAKSADDAGKSAIAAAESEANAEKYAAQTAGERKINFWIDSIDNGLNITYNSDGNA